ncbi:hypothetical protein ACV31O_05840 [Clostridium perfringens]|uniref:hypothetical protein n=1 Tax=Clostridium perfringens TaxID=1502 RepID=UPI000F538CB9|nr:hypothetical protein [Clostridium perfringens]MDK3222621.1 hypothetical protein [Clostridium perfringens]RQN17386.1 hypothetical protein EHZ12_06655 [Clostridium perfringens]
MKPILFNTQMVRAILDGKKTCTRRIIKGVPTSYDPLGYVLYPTDDKNLGNLVFGKKSFAKVHYARPPYKVGDVLYVRETRCKTKEDLAPDNNFDLGDCKYIFKVDDNGENHPFIEGLVKRWRPSIHMPKEAARIFLRVTSIRDERLKDITDEGCYKEGISGTSFYDEVERIQVAGIGLNGYSLERAAFSLLWSSTVREEKYFWEYNPWVWVIEFERIEKGE